MNKLLNTIPTHSTKVILGYEQAPEHEHAEIDLFVDRALLGINLTKNPRQISDIQERIIEIEEQFADKCTSLFERFSPDKSAQVGARLAVVALQIMQGRRVPEVTTFMGHDVPRPILFDRELAPLAAFSHVMNTLVPEAGNLRFPREQSMPLQEMRDVCDVTKYLETTDGTRRMHLVPDARPYIGNANKYTLMFAFDTGDLHPDVYEHLSPIFEV